MRMGEAPAGASPSHQWGLLRDNGLRRNPPVVWHGLYPERRANDVIQLLPPKQTNRAPREPRRVGGARPTEACRPEPIAPNCPSPSVFYALSLSVVAGNDAPLIGECAGRRRRSALEGGDERASLKSALLVRAPDSRTGAHVRSLTRGDHWTAGSASAHSHCSQPP
jgi:hypothetical protein